MKKSNHTEKAFSGALWMLIGLGGRQGLAIVLNVLLARILVPEDFAAVALVSSFIVILNVISQLGISVALVQRPEIDEEVLDSAFALTIGLFSVGAGLLLCLSGPLAQYYEMLLLAPLLKVAAFTFLIQGLASFNRSLLLRDLCFRAISFTEILSTLVNAGIALSTALAGYGAYSILWGNLGAALTTLFIFVSLKRFVPKSLGTFSAMKSLLKFGVWISIGRVLGQASGQFDRLLIGKVLTEQALGGYYLAQRITTILPNLITSMIDQVLLPIYSSTNNDPQVIERGYWKGLRFSVILVVPVCVLIAAYARPLIWLLFGEKWLHIIPLVRIFAIFGALQGMGGGVFASVIYASGIPQLNPIMNGFRILVLPLCVWIGSHWGVTGVAWGVLVFGVAGRFFNQWILKRYLNYSFLKFFGVLVAPLVANMGFLIASIIAARFILLHSIIQVFAWLFLCGIMTSSVYMLLCRFLMPEDSRLLFHQLQRVVFNKLNPTSTSTTGVRQ
jgi:O-antigen/teichoic acid export membrane protein